MRHSASTPIDCGCHEAISADHRQSAERALCFDAGQPALVSRANASPSPAVHAAEVLIADEAVSALVVSVQGQGP